MRDRVVRRQLADLQETVGKIIETSWIQLETVEVLRRRIVSLEGMVAAMAADAITGEG